jgi:hypothetical protein
LNYSNPRKKAVYEKWPCGKYTTRAIFEVESHPKRGERIVRTTLHPFSGKPRAPKKLTYCKKARIVDGSDGKTYIIELGTHSLGINVMKATMDFNAEYIPENSPRHAEILALFDDEVECEAAAL